MFIHTEYALSTLYHMFYCTVDMTGNRGNLIPIYSNPQYAKHSFSKLIFHVYVDWTLEQNRSHDKTNLVDAFNTTQ